MTASIVTTTTERFSLLEMKLAAHTRLVAELRKYAHGVPAVGEALLEFDAAVEDDVIVDADGAIIVDAAEGGETEVGGCLSSDGGSSTTEGALERFGSSVSWDDDDCGAELSATALDVLMADGLDEGADEKAVEDEEEETVVVVPVGGKLEVAAQVAVGRRGRVKKVRKETGVVAKCTEARPGQTRYWTQAEHDRFLEAVVVHGEKAYVAISNFVETRTPKQVRTHAQKFQMKMARLEKSGHALPGGAPPPHTRGSGKGGRKREKARGRARARETETEVSPVPAPVATPAPAQAPAPAPAPAKAEVEGEAEAQTGSARETETRVVASEADAEVDADVDMDVDTSVSSDAASTDGAETSSPPQPRVAVPVLASAILRESPTVPESSPSLIDDGGGDDYMGYLACGDMSDRDELAALEEVDVDTTPFDAGIDWLS